MGSGTKTLSERNYYYDNIKGFLIILVVFGHCFFYSQENPVINAISDFIYMFHMPAFVFVSGYFGKSENARSSKSIIKLIFMYVVFNSAVGYILGEHYFLTPADSFWYLLALITWRITADKVAKLKEVMLILLSISIFAGFFKSIDNTMALSRAIAFYPYYMAGYLLSKEKSEEFENRPYKKRFLMGLGISAGLILAGIIAYRIFEYSDSNLLMSAYSHPLDAFGRIVLYIIAFGAIYALRLFGLNRKIPLISSFGKNSIGIYLFHRPITIFFERDYSGDAISMIGISVLLTLIICLLFGNDYVALAINKVSNGFAELFSEEERDKKSVFKTISMIIMLIIGLCFIFQIVRRFY